MSSTVAEPAHTQEMDENAGVVYSIATDRAISKPHPWQSSLYAQLADSDRDAGYLLLTPTGSGKTEAVILPSLGIQHGGAPRRLFLICADGAPLDDHVVRLGKYLKAWAIADGVPRTMFIDEVEDELDGKAIRYSADGTTELDIAISPLEADVDLILTTTSRFLDLFFGGGGVHGLPSSIVLADEEQFRRDMFFFDEAHSYSMDRFSRFLRLVEFLFARDTDIVVASSTMPPGFEEELSFLEKVIVPSDELPLTITYLSTDNALDALVKEAKARYQGTGRLALVAETAVDGRALAKAVGATFSPTTYCYLPDMIAGERRRLTSRLLDHDAKAEPYVLITTGRYLESSNLDLDVVLTTLCLPEDLILRAGRCNRCSKRPSGQLVVAGNTIENAPRLLNNAQQSAYLEALKKAENAPFNPNDWKPFI